MSKKDKYLDLLIYVYEYDVEKLNGLNEEELKLLIAKEETKAIKKHKNPNRFLILKDLPTPQYVEPKTSVKGGILVIIAFILVFLIFGALMFWWAFK